MSLATRILKINLCLIKSLVVAAIKKKYFLVGYLIASILIGSLTSNTHNSPPFVSCRSQLQANYRT
jgi:hypothetical protein